MTRSRQIIAEAKQIRSKLALDDSDLRRLADLQVELLDLCPAIRYGWHEGVPVIDIWDELIKREGVFLQ